MRAKPQKVVKIAASSPNRGNPERYPALYFGFKNPTRKNRKIKGIVTTKSRPSQVGVPALRACFARIFSNRVEEFFRSSLTSFFKVNFLANKKSINLTASKELIRKLNIK